ncbi:MAG: PQQ-binding-like beta-propeller repeat protein [Planctomycetaceae bacterium]|nr:PQQ-binding-like beta-propeller repeat protein [Planctomycetaceae bacterium]
MEATDARPRKVRWLPGLILLVLAPMCVVAAWMIAGRIADGDRTVQMTAAIVTLAIAVLIQAVWWLGLARLSWRGRLIGLAGLAVFVAGIAAVVRIDGYRGEMMPILAFRWEPTPEERALAFFKSNASRQDATPPEGFVGVTVGDGDWPQYRGANRDGLAPDAVIRTNWNDAPPKLVWGPQPVGPAWSSFAVVGDRAYTQEQRGEEETVVCYDANEGVQRWVHADTARFSETLGGDGPRGTPTIDGGRVYALGATGLLNCLDAASGAKIWQRDILKDAGDGERVANIDWGMAGSPPVWEGKVFAAPGGKKGREVIAYDVATGEIVWAVGDGAASYASPRVETIGGVPHLLVFDAEGLKSFDPSSGRLLWSFGPWTNQPKVNAAQPIVQGNHVFISSGYTIGSVLLKVTNRGSEWKVEEVWRNDNEFKLKFNDAVLHKGFLYGLDEGILACYEFETGERQWKSGRYGYGQIVLLGETLVILAEDGSLAAVSASPTQYEEVARVPVLEGKTWNHPAFARGKLFVRNDREAACLDLSP